MIRSVREPEIINALANHPDVLPHITIDGNELDLSAAVERPNVCLLGEHGGTCWIWSAPDTYEVHVMLTEKGRGFWGVKAGRLAIAEMARRGARHLWCRVHPEKPHIGAYAAACGMKDTGQTHTLDIGNGPVAWRLFQWRLD